MWTRILDFIKAQFEIFYQSVTNWRWYREILSKEDLGHAWRYFFAFTFSFYALAAIWVVWSNYGFAFNFLNQVADNFPTAQVSLNAEEETLEVDGIEEPYVRENDAGVLIIDTTGQIQDLDDYDEGILFTRTRVVTKRSDGTLDERSVAEFPSFVLDGGDVISFLGRYNWVIVLAMYAVITITLWAYHIISKLALLFIFSAIGLGVIVMARAALNFKQLFQLALYCVPLASILAFVAEVMLEGALSYIFPAVFLIYFIGAIWVNRER